MTEVLQNITAIRTMPEPFVTNTLELTLYSRLTEAERSRFDAANKLMEKASADADAAHALVELYGLIQRKAPDHWTEARAAEATRRREQAEARVEELRQRRFEVIAEIVNEHLDAMQRLNA